MFGIGFPELILILALALIVVGPDKLPDLARSIAKTIVDLKKTAESFKESIDAESNPLSDIKPELEDAAKKFRENVLDVDTKDWKIPEDNPDLKKLDPATRELLDKTMVDEQHDSPKSEEDRPRHDPYSAYDDVPKEKDDDAKTA